MFDFLFIFQFIGMILVLIGFVILLKQHPSKLTNYFTCFSFAVFINSLGYMLEMRCTSEEAAFMCVCFAYFGKAYICFTMLMFVLEYCGYKLKDAVTHALFLFHTLIPIFVVTSRHHHMYYTNISYTDKGLFPHLLLSHGPVYFMFTGISLTYAVIVPTVCFLGYRRITEKSEKKQILTIASITLLPLVGYIMYIFKVGNGYDCTSFSYILASIAMYIVFIHTGFFDTIVVAKEHMLDQYENGVIVIDNAGRVLYSNPLAISLIPELSKASTADAIEFLYDIMNSDDTYIKRGRIYKISSQPITHNGTIRGEMLLMNDITVQYNYTRNLESAVLERTEQLKYFQGTVISSLADIIEARDGVTGQHVRRTSSYVKILVNALARKGVYSDELNEETISNIIQAAPLHDIGKISIPDAILCKPGKLEPDEFEVIKTHTTIGANIIDEILKEVEQQDYLECARDVAKYHHEKWDGSGYPLGLSGQDIPLAARIMAITDVYEALISVRPYKKGFSVEKSIEIIKEGAGSHFDPAIVDVFLEIIDQIKAVG